MADLPISGLPLATAPAGTEELAIVQGGITKRTALSTIPTGGRVSTATSNNTAAMGVAKFYAVTDTTAARTITISTSDIADAKEFVITDESRGAGTNNITIETEDETITAAAVAAGSGTDFTATAHGFIIGTVIAHSTFSESTYNGTFTVTDTPDANTYEIATITFVATGTGIANRTIDGAANGDIKITANSGTARIYADNLQNLHGW